MSNGRLHTDGVILCILFQVSQSKIGYFNNAGGGSEREKLLKIGTVKYENWAET